MNQLTGFLPRPLAIAILVLSASLFAGNHIAARFAFDSGAGLLLAVLARGAMALCLMLFIAFISKASFKIPKKLIKWQLLIGVLIAAQSLCLYSAINKIPVAVALLLVNTWPMMFILASWVMGKREPNLKTFLVLLIILMGLILVLDIDVNDTTGGMGEDAVFGMIMASLSALFLTMTMWLTQYQLVSVAGSVRSSYTMALVVIIMCVMGLFEVLPDGLNTPQTPDGWFGLISLAVLYAVAVTMLFVLAPRLDMASNSPVLNCEPVVSLLLAYIFLGQYLNSTQLLGGAVVVLGIVVIGFHKEKSTINP
jgi:drug/metabolite transporter (DMT)-like permease